MVRIQNTTQITQQFSLYFILFEMNKVIQAPDNPPLYYPCFFTSGFVNCLAHGYWAAFAQ